MRTTEKYILRVMSGEQKGVAATILRAVMRLIEPVYIAVVQLRNRKYDRHEKVGGKKVHRLSRKVISVGNLTAGGTGKTPVVHWLVGKLVEQGQLPAVLMRGYKSVDGVSDEQAMLSSALLHFPLSRYSGGGSGPSASALAESLNESPHPNPPPEYRERGPEATALEGESPISPNMPIIVQANPNRVEGAAEVLAKNPAVNVFVMDDGFQHRRLARDFDLVLISAIEPFGYGHVHPRGLLREPIHNIKRASAVLITHADEVSSAGINDIISEIRRYTAVPIFRASHRQVAIRTSGEDHTMNFLAGKKVFAFCGIGNPDSFFRQLKNHNVLVSGELALGDHFSYDEDAVSKIAQAARNAKAELLLTTEKDFAKLNPSAFGMPVGVVVMRIVFADGDETGLLELISRQLK